MRCSLAETAHIRRKPDLRERRTSSAFRRCPDQVGLDASATHLTTNVAGGFDRSEVAGEFVIAGTLDAQAVATS